MENDTRKKIENSAGSRGEASATFSHFRSVADDGRLVLAVDDNLDIVGTLKFCQKILQESSEREKGAIIYFFGEVFHIAADSNISDSVETFCRTNVNTWEGKRYLVTPLLNEQTAYKLEALHRLLKEPILYEDMEGRLHTFSCNMTVSDLWEKHGTRVGLQLPPKVSSTDLSVKLVLDLIERARKEERVITFSSFDDDGFTARYTATFITDRCNLLVSAYGGITDSREDRGFYIDHFSTKLVLDGIEFALNGGQAAELFTKLHDSDHTYVRRGAECGG